MQEGRSGEADQLYTEIVAAVEALKETSTEPVREVRREFSKKIAKESAGVVLELAHKLLDRGEWIYQFIAYELIAYHRAALRSLDRAELERLGRNLDDWKSVDTFAPLLSGPAWRDGQISDSDISDWAHSEDRWWRRAALVSTIALNNKARGGNGDAARTLAVASLMVADHDDMVEKALSWALRELVRHDKAGVQRFVEENDAVIGARVRREVNSKLNTGVKNPRRKEQESESTEDEDA